MIRITMHKDSIHHVYLQYGKKKLETDVDDIAEVLYSYMSEKLGIQQDFGFGADHPGSVYCYDSDGNRMDGKSKSTNIASAVIELFPILTKPTLMKPIQKELDTIDNTPKNDQTNQVNIQESQVDQQNNQSNEE